jgi:hypothetical protein
MTYSNFLRAMLTYKKLSEDFSELDSIGIDFFEGKYRLSELSYSLFKSTFESHYTKEGIEWIDWFVFEADWGQKDFSKSPTYVYNKDGTITTEKQSDEPKWGARDSDGNPIAYSFESLWELLEKDYKL